MAKTWTVRDAALTARSGMCGSYGGRIKSASPYGWLLQARPGLKTAGAPPVMEWFLALVCMVPAAVSDLKDRTVSIESCVAALLVGYAAFAWWALSAPPAEAAATTMFVAAISAVAWAARRLGGGDGDWWFVAGSVAALSTIDLVAAVLAVSGGMITMMVCHVVICARRPGLPFPRRLYRHLKLEGDKFRVDMDGRVVPPAESGMVVYPGLPMVAFVVAASLAAGVWFSA